MMAMEHMETVQEGPLLGQPGATDDLPTIRYWEDHNAYGLMGLAVSVAIGTMASRLSEISSNEAAWLILSIVFLADIAIYALVFYPSYFREHPLLVQSKVICFLNFLFGGMIFGVLWTYNLKRSHDERRAVKGVSYLVAGVLSLVTAVLLIVAQITGIASELFIG